ncbi:hypothetical protein ACGFNU_49860 [Spirillospora sp. NPDC048911]|uniref:hypothetical protein n=1 Tax=Spirillospora sp. NPDC048911 TaxID=3364527 RepID=UPI003720570A
MTNRVEKKLIPEDEQRLRTTITKLKTTIANQNAELQELRQLVTNLTLASAVLTHNKPTPPPMPAAAPDNVVMFRPPPT